MESKLKQEIQTAFAAYERDVTLKNIKVGCVLGMVLMPAGSILDFFVYPARLHDFLALRLLCSLLIGVFLAGLLTFFGRRHYRAFGMILLMMPTTCMSFMIYLEEGSASPYYAGLNVVLLILGFVLHWTFHESLMAVSLVLATYLTACFLHGMAPDAAAASKFFNNLYFLVLTGITVTTGSYFLSALRFREFAGRYELDRHKRELEESNRKLLELDQIKSRFFANISHELRTPLTLMLGPLENLQQRLGLALNEQTRQTFQTMHANGMRLLKLINDLLELVRLDSGVMQVKREPVELGGFIRGLASAARQMALDKQLQLETTVAREVGRVLVDRDKLEKIILNLQFNSLKFTPPQGRVDILARREQDELVIQVKDTGMGIAEKNLPNVFSRFWQADSSARRKYRGVGIGLALVKELTELQGGSVSVQSQEGQGTTFTVRLPFLPASEVSTSEPEPMPTSSPPSVPGAGAGPAPTEEWLAGLYRRAELFPVASLASAAPRLKSERSASQQSAPRVLIADDEPDMLRFLEQQLRPLYRVIEAVDGQQALEEASRALPDLILLDMMMPKKDGLEVCRELREQASTHSIPIVMLTARADEETKMAALSAGADDFLPKPFSTTELHVRVKNLIASHQFQRKLAQQNQRLETTIEQLKETEAQLVQSEKLASLGRMSAGIIHEINNPLNYAKTGIYTLRQHTSDLPAERRPAFEDVLNEVEDGLNRVRNIATELGPFTRQVPNVSDTQNVAKMVESALRFLSHEWKDLVRVEQAVPADLTVWANEAHVIQVLVNLLQNSLDALKEKRFTTGQPTIHITGREANGRCRLSIRDNGPGIPPEVIPKIFEPFFTTKDVGAGMGLGLNICYRIVRGYGGRIDVESKPGEFCEFKLDLPVREPLAQSA